MNGAPLYLRLKSMLVTALVALLIAAAAMPNAAAAEQGTEVKYSLSGQVQAESGSALQASVYIYRTTLEVVAEASTNAQGEFSIELPNGSYIVDVRAAGGAYVMALHHPAVVAGSDLDLGVIALKAGKVYTGTALFDDVPVPLTRVQVQTTGASPELVDYALTDANGRYRVVLPGASESYHLLVPNPDPHGQPAWQAIPLHSAGGPDTPVTGGGAAAPAIPVQLTNGLATASLSGTAWGDYIKNSLKGNLRVEAPAGANEIKLSVNPLILQALLDKNADSGLEIVLGPVSYRLPAELFSPDHLKALKDQLQTGDSPYWTVDIIIRTATTEEVDALRQSAKEHGAELIANPAPVEFRIEAAAGGKTAQWDDFGSIYISRNFHIDKAKPQDSIVGAMLVHGELRPVPAIMRTAQDGSVYVEVKRTGNSLYALLRNDKTFMDVTEQHWAYGMINQMASKLIVQGDGQGRFRPEGNVTRGELVSMIVRALGLTPKPYEGMFADIPASHWSADDVQATYDTGIIMGAGEGLFMPDAFVSRQDAAVMIGRAMAFAGQHANLTQGEITNALSKFADAASIAGYAKSAAAYGVKQGLITGVTETRFEPSSHTTRAQAAVLLLRMLRALDLSN